MVTFEHLIAEVRKVNGTVGNVMGTLEPFRKSNRFGGIAHLLVEVLSATSDDLLKLCDVLALTDVRATPELAEHAPYLVERCGRPTPERQRRMDQHFRRFEAVAARLGRAVR